MDPDVAGRYAAMQVQSQGPVELPHGGVVMYCTPWCPGCRKARYFFNEHNIPFREVDITTVPAAAEQVKMWAGGNRTTPTFDIDGTIIVDWNESKLRDVLKDQL
jgi:glutaredoxin